MKRNKPFHEGERDAAELVRAAGLSRRTLLRGLAAGLALPFLFQLRAAGAAALPGGKPLIVYYSRSGNTRRVAEHIRALTGADMVELLPVQPYPEDYRATTEQAKRELESGFLPPLQTKIANLDAYGTIFVGSPNWWGSVASPVRTFLSEYDLSGKKVALFMTHGGSALGRSMEDVRALCPGAVLLEGFAVRGNRAASARDEAAVWLKRIGLAE